MDEITYKKYNEKAFKSLLLKALRQKKQGATIADMVVLTGLPVDWVEFTVRKLLGDFPCRLRTNEKDELIYIFDLSEKRKSWKDALLQWSKPLKPASKSSKKYFLYQTLSYIFGEARKAQDCLFTEKIILNYIRHNGGQIVVAELIQITGWSIFTAETQATRLLADYNGEVEVTDEGVIIYHFDELKQTSEESNSITDSLKVWERPIPEVQVNDNDEPTNRKLERIHRRNLRVSTAFSVGLGGVWWMGMMNVGVDWLLMASISSLSFSSAFFLIPLMRKFYIYLQNEKIRLQNMETFMLKGIFNRIQSHIVPDKDLKKMIHETKPSKFYEYWWNQQISNASFEFALVLTSSYDREVLLEKKALELEAEISVDEEGNLYYDFERLQKELKAISQRKEL